VVPARDEAVVCVHGLWLSGFATGYWRSRFARAGYTAYAFSHRTVRGALDVSARALADFAVARPEPRIHFVGHSLGAVLIARMLTLGSFTLPGKHLGRVVLAGPPFKDSMAAKALMARGLGPSLVGRPLLEWLAQDKPQIPPHVELGVIAGSRHVGLGRVIAPQLTLPHDGTVSVAETMVHGAREHKIMAVSHTEMLMSNPVASQMLHFVEHGVFAR
jgi:pimeloyl-ACP methyl ester carboxylesterase